MTSLCSHHRVLLLHILQEMKLFLPKDECGPVTMQRDVHGTVGTLRSKYGVSSVCVCSCRNGVCAVRSVCLCMKTCSDLSCCSVTLGCTGCCARSRTLVCQHTHCSDIPHVTHPGSDTHSCCPSPPPPPLSPPPLSPKPQDTESACDPDMPTLNTHTLNTQPPPLLPHNTHTDQMLTPETHAKPEHLIDLMDKFTDTLVEASEREWSVHTHTGDSVKSCDDTHLTEIITTVLHSSSEKDYNLKELFEQHLASEKRSPQTRSQRRQEVMQAISRSHDQAATRRQSLQIKRDLARLEPDVSRKKKRKTHLITHGAHNQIPVTPISHTQNPDTPILNSKSPDTPILNSKSPDTPILNSKSPDMPVSHPQSPDMPVFNTQNLDTPSPHTQSSDMPLSNSQSMDISHPQSPSTPISHAQSLDTSIFVSQSSDMPILHARGLDKPVSNSRSSDPPISNIQCPDLPISHTQNPKIQSTDMPISHDQSPDTPVSHAQISDTLILHTQNPEVVTSHDQGPETPNLCSQSSATVVSHNQNPEMPISHCQSSDTAILHNQNPEMPILHNQNPETLCSHTPSADTPILHTQNTDKSSLHAWNLDTASSHNQSPDTVSLHNQRPDMPSSHNQSLETPSANNQCPETPSTNNQCPETPSTNNQCPETPSTNNQCPETPSTNNQCPETPSTNDQCPETPSLHNQSPEMPSSHNQSPKTASLHNQSPEMPSSHNQSPVKEEACGTVRSRRNIVRPQRLSSYVTEPRKMFYASCRSAKNNSPPSHGTDMPESPPSAVTELKNEDSPQPHAECQLRVKTRRSEEVTRPPSPAVTESLDADDVKYASPIKLMLVSTIKDEDGVKYKLRAAQTHSDEESFDPCVEASWAPNTVKEQAKDKTVQKMSSECTEKLSAEETSNTEALRECNNSVNEAETSIKRGPGRPKKLKAPMEKAVKRPIGRPRKCKPVDTNPVLSEETEKQGVEDAPSGEDGNKNLKITITYGRRKARRMVSEGRVPAEQSKGRTQSSNAEKPAQFTQAKGNMNKDQFSLVMPVEDRKSLTHSIMCPKQSDGTGSRRPGRPAKVKISGISVTVTTVSPQRRKIHMKRDIRGPLIQRRALRTELEPNKEQETITEDGQTSVRHSVRERRPSFHLLQCVAMSRSNTPTPRSRKPSLHEADEETQQLEPMDADDTTTRSNTAPQDAVSFSAASVESLFDANLQWWPTSASPETLKDEMNKRLKVMKETWVSDTSDVATSDEDISSAPNSSAVRMLFERDCSMETLCSWFMQTTETQSLAIVKKANNRTPCEVFQYSSAQASDRPNVCSSPQAERLRKCIKKFATVVPKSPMKLRRAQAKVPGTQKCFTEQHILNTSANNSEKSQQCGAWHLYRTTLDRARSRFKYRTRNTEVDHKSLNEQEESGIQRRSVSENGLLNTLQSESRRTSAQQKQITANAWSPHTLRECKVFLRKLNSANTRAISEESNDCSVRFSVSPAGGGSVQHREQGVRKSIKAEKSSTSTRQQSKVNRKRRHSCTNPSPPSPKRQRSSRGVMAAKWSDFILGPAR